MKPERPVDPFVFCTERRLVVLTGRKATNAAQLLQHLTEVSGSSVFYHTHYLYLSHHYERPTFYNDFANWVSQALQEQRLAERLTAIDLLAITSLHELRENLVAVLRRHLQDGGRLVRECPPGDEFHFCEAKSFVMSTGQVARDVREFFSTVATVSTTCLHFHFFEARLRLERPTNDFSQWLQNCGEDRLARRIDRLNPYNMTLPELQQEIVKMGRSYLRRHQ
jgi:uncharacterized protein DUF5752